MPIARSNTGIADVRNISTLTRSTVGCCCLSSQFDKRNVRTCLGAFPAYSNGLLQKEASYNEAVECIVLLNHAMRRTSTGKALSPTVDRLNCGWMRRLVLAERKARRLGEWTKVRWRATTEDLVRKYGHFKLDALRNAQPM